MKVCVVTIYDNTNYGTYLQAFALNQKIKECGNDSYILNYERPQVVSAKAKLNFVTKGRNPLRIGWGIIEQFGILPLKKAKMKKEIAKLTNVTGKCNSVSKIPENFDVFCTGSDQVWNCDYNKGIDETFFLGFVPDETLKIAYAASVGKLDFEDTLKERVSFLLNRYKSISVRESLTEPLLKSMTKTNVTAVLDPTLLIDKNNWAKIFSIKSDSTRYVLVYSVESNKTECLIQLAKKIAAEKNLQVWVIEQTNPFRKSKKDVDKFIYMPSIKYFLQLFYNATFIVASSFHGTAFSINFNKDFFVMKPDNYNIRIESLLSDYNLSERMVDVTQDIDLTKNLEIDYKEVNKNLNARRIESIKVLKGMLSE